MSSESNVVTGDDKSPVSFDYKMLHNLICPACILSREGKTVQANGAFSALFEEYSPASDIHELDWKLSFGDEQKNFLAKAFVKSANGAFTRTDVTLKSPNTDKIESFEVNFQPLEEAGSIRAVFVVINKGIYVEKSHGEINNLGEAQYFEYSPLPILRFDREYNISSLSDPFYGIFGKIKNQVNPTWDDISGMFKYDSEKIKNSISEIFRETIPYRRLGEVKVILKDKNDGMANIVLYPIKIENKISHVEAIIEDITQIKNLKNKLENFRRMNLINDIGKGFTHSINNILNVLLNQTQLLQILAVKDPVIKGLERIEKYVHQAVEHIKRIQIFIGDYNESNVEKIEILDTVIKDSLEFVKIHFKVADTRKKSTINIEAVYDSGEIRIKTDTQLLRELIIWSMLRVSSYIDKNGIIAVVLTEDNSRSLRITGNKRKNDVEENIVPYTIDGFSSSEIRESAEKINLKVIEHESLEEYSIEILFPNWMIFEGEDSAKSDKASKVTGKKVMIVEDEEGLSTILANLFRRMDNRVYVTDNGKDALEELDRNSYEIIITDYDITGTTGIELAARIKEIDENIITVLMSAWDLGDMGLYDNIVDFFISKPFNIEDLLTIISAKIKN